MILSVITNTSCSDNRVYSKSTHPSSQNSKAIFTLAECGNKKEGLAGNLNAYF